MMCAHASFRTKRFQSHWLFVMFVDRMTNLPHQLDLRIGGSCPARMTAAAGTKTGLFGGFTRRILTDANIPVLMAH